MADNSTLPVSVGTEVFANDDIGGVKYPRVKATWGPDGTANDTDVASGKPMPIQVRASDGTAVAVKAASTAPVATDPALVVTLSPNGVNANGAAAATASAPVVNASRGKAPSASFTPAAAAYLANDTMDTAKEFTGIGLAGDAIRILSAELEVDHTAVISGETSYRLYLYNVTPPSALADNAAWDLPSGDRASFLGYVDLGTPVDLGSTLYVQTAGVDKDILLSGTSIFGYLVTNGAFTATAAARKVTLHTTPI